MSKAQGYGPCLIPGLAILLLGVLLAASPKHSKHAPDVLMPTLDGRQISLRELQGQPVLVMFWATTCRSCREEMPKLIRLYKELAPLGLELIAITMAYDPPNKVFALSKREQIPYPIALDIQGKLALAFGDVAVTPTSYLISPDGKIVKQQIGEMNMEELRENIIRMLPQESLTNPV